MNEQSTPTITKKEEDWMTKKWRPLMAMMYMTVCAFDFIIFPVMFTIVQFWESQAANDAFRQWSPLTLQGAGLFHMAMGAVLGVTAWSRGQEKLAGVTGSSPTAPTPPVKATIDPPATEPYVPPVTKPASADFGIK